jgi:hypothetical protein
MSERGYWYCEHCDCEVYAQCVTYEETHDVCCQSVTWMEYCHECSKAGGADRPIYHEPPMCKNGEEKT